jgi:hypothetical protein
MCRPGTPAAKSNPGVFMHWLLCLFAVLLLAIGMHFGLTVMQVPSLGDLEANDVLVATMSFVAVVVGGWLLLKIALTT